MQESPSFFACARRPLYTIGIMTDRAAWLQQYDSDTMSPLANLGFSAFVTTASSLLMEKLQHVVLRDFPFRVRQGLDGYASSSLGSEGLWADVRECLAEEAFRILPCCRCENQGGPGVGVARPIDVRMDTGGSGKAPFARTRHNELFLIDSGVLETSNRRLSHPSSPSL